MVMTARSGRAVVEPKRYLEQAARAAGIEDPEPVAVEGRLAARATAEKRGLLASSVTYVVVLVSPGPARECALRARVRVSILRLSSTRRTEVATRRHSDH